MCIDWFMLNGPVQDMVLMRALRDMNLPKFVFEDVPLFLGLISDLFPGLHCPRVRYADFNGAVEHSLHENRFSILPDQVSHWPFYLSITVANSRFYLFRLLPCYRFKEKSCLTQRPLTFYCLSLCHGNNFPGIHRNEYFLGRR